MNVLIILLMLAALGTVLVLQKQGKGSMGVSGGLLAFVLLAALISLSRSCGPPPEELAEKKVEIFEAIGWKTAQLINESIEPEKEIVLLRPKGKPASSLVPPFDTIEEALLRALDNPDRAKVFHIELPPGFTEGITVDQLTEALSAHPAAGAIVSLIGAPKEPDGMSDANPDRIPLYTVCYLEMPKLRKMAKVGMLTALVPLETGNWNKDATENTPQAVFDAYCAVYSKKP